MAKTARIKDLSAIFTPSDSDRLAIDGLNGTESVSVADLSDTVLNKLSGSKTYDLDIGKKTLVSAINEIHKAGTDTSQETANVKTLAENTSNELADAKSEIAKLKLVHRIETQSVPIDGWLSRTIDGTMYFAYTITLTNEFDPDHCTVTLLPSGSNILPTQDEAKAYNKCFATLDGKTMYICCATGVPPTAFNIKIEGIVSTSGS